jgi:hypothetical protein
MTTLTSAQLRQALSLREKIDKLELELATLLGSTPTARRSKPPARSSAEDEMNGKAAKKTKRTMSAAGRAKIAAAARKRWKLAKAAGKSSLAR